ncbi:MAG: hypothetical protein ABI883_08035, partial [Chthoniobacterales bacterium]
MRRSLWLLFALLALLFPLGATAQEGASPAPTPPPIRVPAAAVEVKDPAAATRAWLETVPADKREKSDA